MILRPGLIVVLLCCGCGARSIAEPAPARSDDIYELVGSIGDMGRMGYGVSLADGVDADAASTRLRTERRP